MRTDRTLIVSGSEAFSNFAPSWNISLTVSPIMDGEGHIVGASQIARDITERKQWEDALRVSEHRLRAFSGQLEQLVQERTDELTQSHDSYGEEWLYEMFLF